MKVKKILSYIIVVVLLSILCITFYSKYILKEELIKIFDYAFLVVITGSMEPTIHSGELIIIKEQNDYNIDDIVTYIDNEGDFITHRIISKINDKYVTKGDSNNISDKEINFLQIEGNVIMHSYILGFFILYLLKPVTLIYILAILLFEFRKNKTCEEKYESRQIN